MSVEIVRRLEWEEGPNTHHKWPHDLIADVQVEMRAAPPGPPDQAVRRIGRFRREHVELGALLHAAKDEIHADAATAGEPLVVRSNVVFFLDACLRPRD